MKLQLIEKIEIRYFRSVHSADLKKCSPLNIIVGGNDSGKSNVLRALNLFFNKDSDFGCMYDFYKDLSKKRLEETRKTKTKAFLYVKITFNNIWGWKSLPQQFSIKRQWNKDSLEPGTYHFPSKVDGKPLNTATITKFLNKIELHYVPAVKGRDIFSFYLGLLHDVLTMNNVDFTQAVSGFSDLINTATKNLSDRIQDGIGIKSQISFPTNLSSLFADLDFNTELESKDWVLLKQRGDGIQVGHIPYILDFISRQVKGKAFIWLYEEPENSLEMTKAFELAEKFMTDFSGANQIFLTTHSPAFYGLEGAKVSKWYVEKVEEVVSAENGAVEFSVSNVQSIDNIQDVDLKLGVAALTMSRAKEAYEELSQLKNTIAQIQASTRPIILCEGKTDVCYIKKAIELNNKESLLEFCQIRAIGEKLSKGGCSQLKAVLNHRKDHPYLYNSRALLVFDCDVEGVVDGGDDLTHVYKFDQFDPLIHPRKNGIENALPLPLAQEIQDNTEFWNSKTIEQSGGNKIVVTRELDKVKVCKFVCERNEASDFDNFSAIISRIERLVSQ